MRDNQKTLKQFKIFQEVVAHLLAISLIGLIVGCVIWIWFGTVGFKILLTSIVCTIFFSMWFKVAEKGVKEREVKENE